MEYLLETPQDPAVYKPELDPPTFTNWPELQTVLEKDLQLRKIAVDQGALGHQRRKPTCLWSNIEEIVAVHGMKDTRNVETWPRELNEAMSCSKQLAAWAPGLKWKLVNSWTRRAAEGQVQVRALRDKECEEWYKYIVCGHIPFRRDCGECLRAAGRDRPRSRQEHPDAYALSNPFKGDDGAVITEEEIKKRAFKQEIEESQKHECQAFDIGCTAPESQGANSPHCSGQTVCTDQSPANPCAVSENGQGKRICFQAIS